METRIIALASLKPSPFNPRVELTPKDSEWKALDASIAENGLVLPLIVNARDNTVIGGHQRLNVLRAAGETETNAIFVDLDQAQAKALCIALNKLDGEWDYGRLADILQELIDESENFLSTGFTDADVNELLGDIAAELGETPPPNRQERKKDDDSIPCAIGTYRFKMSPGEYDDLIADIHEKAGFTTKKVCEEIERRLFGEVRDQV